MRSSIRKRDSKASTTIQPFYFLHLDIEVSFLRTSLLTIKNPNIYSLDHALSFFMTPEPIEGYQDSKTKIEVHLIFLELIELYQLQASKYTLIEKLPYILTIHLKRFSFEYGTQKINKFISYPEILTIHPNHLVSNINAETRKYRLYAGSIILRK